MSRSMTDWELDFLSKTISDMSREQSTEDAARLIVARIETMLDLRAKAGRTRLLERLYDPAVRAEAVMAVHRLESDLADPSVEQYADAVLAVVRDALGDGATVCAECRNADPDACSRCIADALGGESDE